jgi:Mg/Co/Ni transporter MgtE
MKVLEEAGIDHHLDFSGDEDFETHISQAEPSLMRNVMDRSGWLIGLLIFQSLSSFILRYNEALLQNHPSIVYFLTMLVGAGGNAGNQATVRAIRGIALGTLKEDTFVKFITKEAFTGMMLSVILGFFGFLRVTVLSSSTTFAESIAISIALLTIVFSSVFLGALLPILFHKIGIDPAHGGTTIQVVMDILGVIITCTVSTKLLDGVLSHLLK